MRFEDHATYPAFIREIDFRESRDFLIGLANGIWMSALITYVVYCFLSS